MPHIINKRTTFAFTVVIIILYYFATTSLTKKQESKPENLRIVSKFFISFQINPSSSFVEEMESFPWLAYKETVERFKGNKTTALTTELKQFSGVLLLKLLSFIRRAPSVPVNTSCVAPPLQMPLSKKLCISLSKPRKVAVLLLFGFDLDSLEIHLNELDAVVDKFFIIESVKPHSSIMTRKPLLWDSVKFEERFLKFSEKVVQFVVDDADLAQPEAEAKKGEWTSENLQEELRWHKFQEWNNATGYFSDDDLVGFGDADEVPDRNNIFFIKHCQLPSNESVDIGIWFPFDGMNSVFKPDFPVSGHPYTLGDPTFWTVRTAKNYYNRSGGKKQPSRMRGKSFGFLLGGMHLSRYAYPPFQIAKLITASETDMNNVDTVIKTGMLYAANKSAEASKKLNDMSKSTWRRVQSVDTFRKKHGEEEANNIVKIPWFLNCNPKRYPGFWKEYDFRLDATVETAQSQYKYAYAS